MNKIVLITGTTSGFGRACAYEFARNGFDIIINGRRRERLDRLQKELEDHFGIRCLSVPFDVRSKEAVFTTIGELPEEWKRIDILINNAGLALGKDPFDQASLEDWDQMIDTNLKGLLYVSKAVIPFMVERKQGHIINVGSTAAKEVYEGGNVYCASKSAVEAVSKAMRIDLLPHHIKVTAVHPGAAETEFSLVRFKGSDAAAQKVYEGFTPLSAEDVAGIIYYTASLPAHVCINDLVVTCTQQANSYYIDKSGKKGL
ncbi:MAG: SDR family NAD(P)-dependent oxidoreductase [Flavisolibacter sp.]